MKFDKNLRKFAAIDFILTRYLPIWWEWDQQFDGVIWRQKVQDLTNNFHVIWVILGVASLGEGVQILLPHPVLIKYWYWFYIDFIFHILFKSVWFRHISMKLRLCLRLTKSPEKWLKKSHCLNLAKLFARSKISTIR